MHIHLSLEKPVWLALGIQAHLIDRDDLQVGITVRIKALMPGDAIVLDILDGGNDRRTERLGASGITGVAGSMRPICQSGLDRLDQDVRAVIGSSAVDVVKAALYCWTNVWALGFLDVSTTATVP